MAKTKEPLKLENKGSLITIAGTNRCLGFLANMKARGVFDPQHGRVEVTEEEADKHNQLFSQALVDGLKTAEMGQGNTFYYRKESNTVVTFIGQEVSKKISTRKLNRQTRVTFYVGERAFEGVVDKLGALPFRRIH
jgi:hypothetical protein